MADQERLNVQGVDDFKTAIDSMIRRVQAATISATTEAGNQLVVEAVRGFSGAHPIGAPHVGGTKPNTVTGNLQRSIVADPVKQAGANRWSVTVGPRAIYARLVELGGHITPKRGPFLVWTLGPRPSSKEGWQAAEKAGLVRRARSVTVAPHPYFTPAYLRVVDKLPSIFAQFWGKALES